MDAFYRLLLQSVLILPSAFAETGIAAPRMKCTSKVGQKCKTFGGAFFYAEEVPCKKNTNFVGLCDILLVRY